MTSGEGFLELGCLIVTIKYVNFCSIAVISSTIA